MGFIPDREGRDNTQRVLSAIHFAKQYQKPLVLISTDAEKAFDRVDWTFLRATIQHIGLKSGMQNWITSLYSCPRARIKKNDTMSEPFSICNGTRQGCLLSPIIFILTLESFLRTIRANPDIRGIAIKGEEHKVAAYADDLLFFITSPVISLPSLLSEIRRYGGLSNFKVNYSKSEAMGIEVNPGLQNQLTAHFAFRWTDSHICYLGTKIPNKLSRVFELNFAPLARQIKSDLQRWDREIFTWFGRINIIKMNVMPRLIYLFQTLPIKISPGFLEDMRARFVRLIWAGKSARVRRDILTLPKERGGVGFPDPVGYYEASHLARVIDWCVVQKDKPWIHMEQATTNIPLEGIAWLLNRGGLTIGQFGR